MADSGHVVSIDNTVVVDINVFDIAGTYGRECLFGACIDISLILEEAVGDKAAKLVNLATGFYEVGIQTALRSMSTILLVL